jgi:hypothetical protein
VSDVRSPMTTAPAREGVTVVLGSTVRVRDTDGEHEHTVVGRVAVGAPTGMGLRRVTAGHGCAQAQASDEVEAHTCSGVRLLTVVAIATVAARIATGHARARRARRCRVAAHRMA